MTNKRKKYSQQFKLKIVWEQSKNSNDGVQFTAHAFTQELAADIGISVDGRGWVIHNIFVEHLWRVVKYEDIHIKEYAPVPALFTGLSEYFNLYNYERPHQSLDYSAPTDVYFAVKQHEC